MKDVSCVMQLPARLQVQICCLSKTDISLCKHKWCLDQQLLQLKSIAHCQAQTTRLAPCGETITSATITSASRLCAQVRHRDACSGLQLPNMVCVPLKNTQVHHHHVPSNRCEPPEPAQTQLDMHMWQAALPLVEAVVSLPLSGVHLVTASSRHTLS